LQTNHDRDELCRRIRSWLNFYEWPRIHRFIISSVIGGSSVALAGRKADPTKGSLATTAKLARYGAVGGGRTGG
jgi:hypothetical protein